MSRKPRRSPALVAVAVVLLAGLNGATARPLEKRRAEEQPAAGRPTEKQPATGRPTDPGNGRAGWRLVWSDEFTGSAVDRSKWNVRDGEARDQCSNPRAAHPHRLNSRRGGSVAAPAASRTSGSARLAEGRALVLNGTEFHTLEALYLHLTGRRDAQLDWV